MKRYHLFFLPLLLIVFNAVSKSPEAVIFKNDDTTNLFRVNKNIFILEDKLSAYTFDEVKTNKNFTLSSLQVPNLGVSNSTFWIKFSIRNESNIENLLLQLSSPLMDIADLYCINEKGNYNIIHNGDLSPFSKRKFKNPNFIYEISIPKNETKTYYLKIKATEQILVPIYIGTKTVVSEINSFTDINVGIYIGIILVMFIYNCFIYITVKDINYLYYIIAILFVGLTQITLLGYSSKLIWPNNYWLSSHGLYIVAAIGSSAIALFMKNFLNMKVHTPKLVYGVYVIIFIYALAIITALTENQNISYNLIDINGILIAFFSLFIAIKISIIGYRPARFYLISWSVFLIGVFVFVFRSFGILPYNNFTNYTMPAGSALEVTLLSLALADRINILKKEKEESQAQAFDALLQNELIIRNQNIVLENKVEARTKELKNINQELSTTLTELKQTQSQLVNAEKMASLGQLTAGIAHEINNPINFVVSNVKPLNRDIEDIYELINRYDEINTDENNTNEKILDVRKYSKEIDYEYLKQEIGFMLKGIEEGAVRTADIVKGLRVFSRLDENDLKRTDITEGIIATLTLLNPELGTVDLIKKFSSIPQVECFPGKLNQVFMNILNNAIYAIKENKHRSEKGKLIITTYYDHSFVYISVKDNGIGMKEDTKKKIFDPFFTTKPVGKGTGLGMSITFSIINDHHGSIEVISEYEKGSEFIIKLPIDHTKNNND